MALNLSTEALARASARRPWLVVGAWAAVFAISIALISGLLSDALTNEVGFTNNPDSKRADTLLEQRLRGPEKVNEIVIVRSADRTVDDAAFKAFVEGLYADVAALGPDVIEQGASYYQTGDESLVSADRRTTILPFVMAGDETQADENIDDVLKVVREADGVGGFKVLITGGASVGADFQEVAESDLQTGEAFGIPIALVVLVIVFGTVTAALVPLVLGVFSIVVAVGLTALLGQGFEFSFFVT
ncbi:MAG: MMPL family transporter, partial [Dehalococcoidia bacterium]|nr:MMPL family transporter [Dehalococcoidia bacterium]